jgi:hypothetical protein
MSINTVIDEATQIELVSKCEQFKRGVVDNAQDKKRSMWRAYNHYKSRLSEGDLLPSLSYKEGAQNDEQASESRPQIFIPMSRAQVKKIHAELCRTLFPNDTDFFRVVGTTEAAAVYEDTLTEGFKWLFKKARLVPMLKKSLLQACWSGFPVAQPTMKPTAQYVWKVSAETGNYELFKNEGEELGAPALPHIEVFNPIDFYPDPSCQDPAESRWVYCSKRKVYEFTQAGEEYFNIDKLPKEGSSNNTNKNNETERYSVSEANGLSNTFNDIEAHVDYDLYYFPYLRLMVDNEPKEFRNYCVGIANKKTVVRFHPNLSAGGLNPVVFTSWLGEVESPYGTSPVEDMSDLQRTINMMWNMSIEKAAREGNVLAVGADVDTSQMTPIGGLLRLGSGGGDVRQEIALISGGFAELAPLLNMIGVLKSEAQLVSGDSNPFQGSAQIDFKKTATELSILDENSKTISQEVVENLSSTYIQPCLYRLMMEAAETFSKPLTIRVDDDEATKYQEIDFSVVKQLEGQFTLEITSVNMSLSRLAIFNQLKELLGLLLSNPMLFEMAKDKGYQLIKRLLTLAGIKETDEYLNTPSEMANTEQVQQGIAQALQAGDMVAAGQIALQHFAEQMGLGDEQQPQ